jgi:hypothetical protein
MKRIIALFAITWLSLGLLRTKADDVSVEVFYNQLAPYGDWLDAGDYGYVWHPRDVGDDWRPYVDGHWAYTDAGWTWLSDEPYSWAVYHYGRWTKLADVGWVWAPGTEWGPAWVSFRYSNRHVGWAPLPPEAEFGGEAREIGPWSDSYYDVGPTNYIFVDVRNFGAPRLRDFELPLNQNVTFIDETTNITNIRVENNGVFLGGPDFDVINRESAQKIPRLQLERRTNGFGADPNSFRASVQGNSLRVAAPAIAAAAATVAPPKIARKLQTVQVNHGWTGAGDPSAVQKLRAKLKTEAKIPAGLPAQPKFQRTAATAGAAGTPAVKPANASAQPAGSPATAVPAKPGAPVEKPAAAQSVTQTATPAPKDNKGKRGRSTPAIVPTAAAAAAAAPAIRKSEPAIPTEREPERHRTAPAVGAVPANEPVKPVNREGQEPAPRGPRPEPQIKPPAGAPKPEAQAKPEQHHAPAPAAAADKDKKKDEKKPE